MGSGNKSQLPPASVLAERIRNGETVESIASDLDANPHTIRSRVSMGGWSTETGEPKHRRPLPLLDFDPRPDRSWHERALCAQTDPEGFFPERGGSARAAKAVCNGVLAAHGRPARLPCPVRDECLTHALENDESFGVWGGLSERERRKLKRAAS